MITTTSISGVTDYVDSTETTTDSTDGTLGKDTFMTLLLAQLQNQDPLNPMDSTEFSAQLAQFTSLEQMYNVNENLETLVSAQETSNQYQVLDLIGKQIEADGDILVLGEVGSASGSFTIESEADCTVVVYDADGEAIKTIDMGSLEAGDHTFKWDGTDQDGDEVAQGIYGFEIIAEGASGESVTAETRIKGIIDRVTLEDDEPVLYVGSLYFTLSEITDITLPADE